MIKHSELLDISLKTDVDKLNKYIDQQKKFGDENPLIRLANEEFTDRFNFSNYIYEYLKVLNAYVLEKYGVSNAISHYDRIDCFIFAFKGIYNDYFMTIKRYISFDKCLQSFELVKNKMVELVDDYYTNLHNAKDYANEFLDKLELKFKKYYSIDYNDISITRKEFKHHIRFCIKYKQTFISEDNLSFIEYPYWKNKYKFPEKDIVQEILFKLTSEVTFHNLLDKDRKLSYKDSMLLLNNKLDDDINLKKYAKYFPQKAYNIYQARNILNELSQN